MIFKVKEYMFNVLPWGPVGILQTGPGCGGTRHRHETGPEAASAALADLREQLKNHLVHVERQQAAGPKRLLPPSAEEVDMLTGKLKDAIKELETHRAELTKKPRPAAKKTAAKTP